MEEILDEPQLGLAADEGRLEAHEAASAAAGCDDAHGAPERHGLGLPLELVRPGVLAHDGGLHRAARGLVHEHRSRQGGRLDAGRRVDEIPRDDPLVLGADGDCGFARRHARAQPQSRDADLRAERGDVAHEVERGPHGTFGVVLSRDGSAPDGHDGVADELLDRAAVPADHGAGGLEVPRQDVANLLGVLRLRERREPDEVGEEHGHEPALGVRGRGSRR